MYFHQASSITNGIHLFQYHFFSSFFFTLLPSFPPSYKHKWNLTEKVTQTPLFNTTKSRNHRLFYRSCHLSTQIIWVKESDFASHMGSILCRHSERKRNGKRRRIEFLTKGIHIIHSHQGPDLTEGGAWVSWNSSLLYRCCTVLAYRFIWDSCPLGGCKVW